MSDNEAREAAEAGWREAADDAVYDHRNRPFTAELLKAWFGSGVDVGWDAAMAAKAESVQINQAAVSSAIGAVLFNVMNFPEKVQSRLLGQDMGPLRAKLTDAVMGALAKAEPVQIDRAVCELTEAIRLTVEYVGNDTLPAIEGWSWFDALRKYAPEDAERFANAPIHLAPRAVTGTVETVDHWCAPDCPAACPQRGMRYQRTVSDWQEVS